MSIFWVRAFIGPHALKPLYQAFVPLKQDFESRVACPCNKVPDCSQTEISNIFGVLLPCSQPPSKRKQEKECLSVARTAHLHKIPADVSCFALHFLHEEFLLAPLCIVRLESYIHFRGL